jgi:hypothetical protein
MLRSLFWPRAVIRGWLGESIADVPHRGAR